MLGLVPLPVRATDCGLPEALSGTVTLALRLPTAVGAKVTMNVQLAAAASELPQVLLVREKSLLLAPVTLGALVIDRLALPVFVRVTVCP